jgi:hypothetical protein
MTRSKMMLSTMILGQKKLFSINEESNVVPLHSVKHNMQNDTKPSSAQQICTKPIDTGNDEIE